MEDAIFLSAGIPDVKRCAKYAETANSVAIAAAVSALVHVTLGRRPLIWGGHPAITPMIWAMAQSVEVSYSKWVRLYQSRFFEDEFPEDNARFQNICYVDAVEKNREKSLLKMREVMFSEHKFKAAIFIGGMGGIIDEFELFRKLQPAAQTIPVISSGGAAVDVARRLSGLNADLSIDLDYVAMFHRYLGISVKEKRYAQPEDQPTSIDLRLWSPPKKNNIKHFMKICLAAVKFNWEK